MTKGVVGAGFFAAASLAMLGVMISQYVKPSSPPALVADSPIRKIMSAAYRGPQSLSARISQALAKAPPDWDEAERRAGELSELAASLADARPRRGSESSWAELTSAHRRRVQTLETAAHKKDKSEALAANKTLSGSCTECHRLHR